MKMKSHNMCELEGMKLNDKIHQMERQKENAILVQKPNIIQSLRLVYS